MRSIGSAGFAGALLLLSAAWVGAGAQQVLSSPAAVSGCLCQDQQVTALENELQAQSRNYEDRRKAVEALDEEVRTKRAQINVADPAELDAFKHLLAERDAAADAFTGEVTRSYADAVARYNKAVTDFNGSCAGRSYDSTVLAQVRGSLVCTAPAH